MVVPLQVSEQIGSFGNRMAGCAHPNSDDDQEIMTISLQ